MKTSTPKAPKVQNTIAAQTKATSEAAKEQQLMNQTNQQGPTGSLAYNTGKDGRSTATVALSGDEKDVYNTNVDFRKNASGTGLAQLGAAAPMLSTPIDLSDPNIGREITSKLEPEFLRTKELSRRQRDSELANKGLFEGSEGWTNAMREFDANYNDAWNRHSTSARGQIVNEMLTGRNQPIQEITALEGLAPVQWPGSQFINPPQVNIQPTNVAGITQQDYENRLAAAQMKQSQKNAMIGGLFGLGGAVVAGATGGLPLAAGGLMQPKSSQFAVA